MKINTANLQHNWSEWHSASSQSVTLVVKHGKCVLSGDAELTREGRVMTLEFPVPEKPKAKKKTPDPIERVIVKTAASKKNGK